MTATGDGAMRRLWARLRGAGGSNRLDPDRADLVVVASGFDDAEACSTSLARATGWIAERPVVLRHLLVLPGDAIDDAAATVAQDGYRISPADPATAGPDPHPGSGPDPHPGSDSAAPPGSTPDGQRVIFERVQILDALHCSQERSRMAGLAQRRGGTVLGWLALQPPVPPGR
ncbi:hypothetical protein [Millisia brevis]|uniref:hypothetical protein n=1 Tax=Millisia brevis TaxID=264148 RepID=UPI000B10A137